MRAAEHSHILFLMVLSWHAGKSVVVAAQSKDTDFDSILTTLADKVWHNLSQVCEFTACQPVDPSWVSHEQGLGQCQQLRSHDGVHAVYAV